MSEIRWVRQEDPSGCVIASLAMVTGRSYATVKSYFEGMDFGDKGGIIHTDAEQYLADTGFAGALKYRFLPRFARVDCPNRQFRSPWPEPFAPAHLIGINSGRHCVVLLRDGTVLDPLQAAPRRIEDCGEVSYVLGVFKVSSDV